MRSMTVIAAAALAIGFAWTEPALAGASPLITLTTGTRLSIGERLTSPHDDAYLTVTPSGQLVVSLSDGKWIWATGAQRTPSSATYAFVSSNGNLILTAGHAPLWWSHTYGSGSSNTLSITDSGDVHVNAGPLLVWTSHTGDMCRGGRSAKWVLVRITTQSAAMCAVDQQLRYTPVTTGASALGDGTPTGTFSIYAKQTDTVLYPSSGGAYPVEYWLPYSGPYGLHDASWQTIPYGSASYPTKGSHGCVHVPLTAMGWMYQWIKIGTLVVVRP